MTLDTPVDRHEAVLAEISLVHPNTIRVLRSPHPLHRYTCMMHAFDFTERPEYIAAADRNLFAGADFANWLLDGRLSPISRKDARAGDLVFYAPDERFAHVGLWTGTRRVVSKWGTGLLYDHKVLEVPTSYGDEVRYFKGVSYEEAWQLFASFAQRNEIRSE